MSDVNQGENYFPPLPNEAMAIINALWKNLEPTEIDLEKIYGTLSNYVGFLEATKFGKHEDFTVVSQDQRQIHFPRDLPPVKYAHIVCNYARWLERKYSLPNFVTVEKDDVVFDCGAYVGGFSLNAQQKAAVVHMFEPERNNFECVRKNFMESENVVTNHAGLFDSTTTIGLNISDSSVEHSILLPDNNVVVEIEQIQVYRVDDYCAKQGLDRIDFLKVEAEGVEYEIIQSIGEIRPMKMAIDVSPERGNTSPFDDIAQYLKLRNYEIVRRGNVMFARINK